MVFSGDVVVGNRMGRFKDLGAQDRGPKSTKNSPKKSLIFVTAGAPGRGVLRFLAEAYRNPVHFLGFFAFFSQNCQT